MRKWIVALVALLTIGGAGLALAAVVDGKISLKAGDVVYVCGCGEGCPCETIARKEGGKCSCGKALVEGKVVKVEEGKAIVAIDGKERAFKTTGKYVCPCGEMCPCDTISQKPGKCGCGKELKEVKP
jgi:hypothetical protein